MARMQPQCVARQLPRNSSGLVAEEVLLPGSDPQHPEHPLHPHGFVRVAYSLWRSAKVQHPLCRYPLASLGMTSSHPLLCQRHQRLVSVLSGRR